MSKPWFCTTTSLLFLTATGRANDILDHFGAQLAIHPKAKRKYLNPIEEASEGTPRAVQAVALRTLYAEKRVLETPIRPALTGDFFALTRRLDETAAGLILHAQEASSILVTDDVKMLRAAQETAPDLALTTGLSLLRLWSEDQGLTLHERQQFCQRGAAWFCPWPGHPEYIWWLSMEKSPPTIYQKA